MTKLLPPKPRAALLQRELGVSFDLAESIRGRGGVCGRVEFMVRARQGSFGDVLGSHTYVFDVYHSPLRKIQ
jgi:hypothetical protein